MSSFIFQDAHLPQVMSARVEVHCLCCEDTILADVEGHLQARGSSQGDMYETQGLMSADPSSQERLLRHGKLSRFTLIQ